MVEAPVEEVPPAAPASASGGGAIIALVPPCRLIVKCTAGARVIGKGGESIKRLRASTGASVKILQEELPEGFKRRQECIVYTSCGEAARLRETISGILDRIFDRSGLPETAERGRERPYVVEVIVPEDAAGLLVGPGGERIKSLIQELECDLNVVREPLSGISRQRRVRVSARSRQLADNAVWRLQELLAEFIASESLTPDQFELREELPTDEERQRQAAAGEETPVRLLLAKGEAASVVGKMGANVNRLRDIAHVSIDDAPRPFDPSERICFVAKATLADRLRVVRLVLGDLCVARAAREELSREGVVEGTRPASCRLLLPSSAWSGAGLSKLLVDEGSGSNQIRALTGAQASGFPTEGHEFVVIRIEGTEEEVAAAVYHCHQAVEPWEPSQVPPRLAPPPPRGGGGDEERGEGKGRGKGKGKGPPMGGSSTPRGLPSAYGSMFGNSGRQNADGSSYMRSEGRPLSATPSSAQQQSEAFSRSTPAAASPSPAPYSTSQSTSTFSSAQPQLQQQQPHVQQPHHPVQQPQQHEPHQQTPSQQQSQQMPVPHHQGPDSPKSVEPQSESPPRPYQVSSSALPLWQQSVPVASKVSPPPRVSSSHPTTVNTTTGNTSIPGLLVAVPSDSAASWLSSSASGIAKQSGAQLRAWAADTYEAQAPPAVEIIGDLMQIAMATYFVQAQMWVAVSMDGKS